MEEENIMLKKKLAKAMKELEYSRKLQWKLASELIRTKGNDDNTCKNGVLKIKTFQPQKSSNKQHLKLLTDDIYSDLLSAAGNGKNKLLSSILEISNVDLNEVEDDLGTTPLINASKCGQVATVEFLLARGAETDRPDNQGSTPLTYAAKSGHVQLVEMLLSHGASIDHRNIYAMTPLFCAAKEGHSKVVDLLVGKGADVSFVNIHGSSALATAVYHDNAACVKTLLETGADINLLDESKWSPLVSAIQRDNVHIVNLLLDAGADVNLKNVAGWTALFFAVKNNDVKIGVKLLQSGANINQQTMSTFSYYDSAKKQSIEIGKGWTALMMACFLGFTDFVYLLVTNGADVNIKGNDGKTALEFAKTKEIENIIKQ